MKKDFERFKEWLNTNYKDGLSDLNPPASDKEIEELSKVIGIDLPVDFITVLKIHNGQKGESAWLFDSQEFLSTHRIIEEWNTWKRLLEQGSLSKYSSNPDPGVKNDWWNEKWIPFTSTGSGDHYCLDMSPENLGKSGQIITLWHDFEDRELVSISFKDWFNDYINQLFSGDLVYSKEYNSIVHKDEL